MSVLATIEEFEAALDALRAAFARQLADDAATIQSLLREQGDMRAAVERCAELETALARVTAQLDEARRMAATLWGHEWVAVRLNAIESMRRAALRATPTEGE